MSRGVYGVIAYTDAMNLTFERGDESRPRGHAVLYFTTGAAERILATYIIVPPIPMNLAKYLPAMFASALPVGDDATRPVPLPPVPEEVSGRGFLQRLAEMRDDDLIFGGSVYNDDLQRLMLETGYASEAYLALYQKHADTVVEPVREVEAHQEQELDPAAAVYAVMSEGQRLAELTKFVGTLRESAERRDARSIAETTGEMKALLATLPAKYRGDQLLQASLDPTPRGRELCGLLLERAYALHHEEYLNVGRIDGLISDLEKQDGGLPPVGGASEA